MTIMNALNQIISKQEPGICWKKILEIEMSLVAIKKLMYIYSEYGIRVYIWNVEGKEPENLYEEIHVKIYYK